MYDWGDGTKKSCRSCVRRASESMNPQIVTTLGTALAMMVAIWSIMSNFDKRNGDRFNALEKELHETRETLRGEIQASKETLRAEMLQMRAELKLEIRDAADRRVSTK